MAIPFLNNIDLSDNQLLNAKLQITGTAPAAEQGQVYFNSAAGFLKPRVYDGAAWLNILDTTSVISGTYVSSTVTSNVDLTLDLSAVDGTSTAASRFLTKDNEWATIPFGDITAVLSGTYINVDNSTGPEPTINHDLTTRTDTASAASPGSAGTFTTVDSVTTNTTGHITALNLKTITLPTSDNYVSWTLGGDSGTPQTISSGNTALFTGGTKITTAVAATDVLTITHDAQAQTDTTSTAAPGYLGTFTAIDTVSRDSTGHVTGVNVKTITIPASDDTTYDLTTALTGTAVRLTDGVTPDDVTISGTTGRTAMSRINASELRVDLTDDVTIINDLTVGGVITQSGGTSTTGVNAAALTGSTTLVLTANNAAVLVGMQVTGAGIGENITITTVTDAKTFQLDGAITIANGITITFEEQNSFSSPLDMNNNRINEVKTGVLGTDGVNLAQVNSLVAGIGVFKGGFNATTGLTVPGGQELEGTSNIALDKGDYFVVTTAGSDFFTLALEPGDFIFAEIAIAANSSPVVGDYIVVQADANVAGAGATDGATQKGVAGFDSATFDVSANGWVQLKPLANPYGTSVTLTSGVDAGGETTFTVDVTALFGATASAANCKAEVLRVSDLGTVYPEVSRNGTGDILFKFAPVVADSAFKALITIV
jgi:hypothetical protein